MHLRISIGFQITLLLSLFCGKVTKDFCYSFLKVILIFLNSCKVLLNFLNMSSNCYSKFLIPVHFSDIFLKIFQINFHFFKYFLKFCKNILKIFFSENFSKMSKQVTLTLDNISQHRS